MRFRGLIIEDDHVLADVLRMKLDRDNHEVTVASNRRDAYHLLDLEEFDFALLDLRLPTYEGDMDKNSEVGFEILDHIRDRFTQDELPVLVMTAYEETSETAVRALKAMANDYITKPFEDSPVSLDEKLDLIFRGIQETRRKDTAETAAPLKKAHSIVFKRNRHVEVDGIEIPGRSADLIWLLGKRTSSVWFQEADHGELRVKGRDIAKAMGTDQDGVSTIVYRFRTWITKQYRHRNMGPIDREAIIRNDPWKGYELNREACDFSYED